MKAVRGRGCIGLLSDTHDHLPMIDLAVNTLNELEVDLVLHAGDYVSPFTVQHFKPLTAKLVGVYGNNCAERMLLKHLFSDIGADLRGFFAEITVGEVKVALVHGHDAELLHSLIRLESYDLVVHGHTHRVCVQRKGKTLVVNPGEVCGYLSGQSTIGLYDPQLRDVKILSL